MYYPIESVFSMSPMVSWLLILPAVALITVGIIKFLIALDR